MEYQLRVLVEKVSVKTQKVMEKETLEVYDVMKPESILDLGLRHVQQIELWHWAEMDVKSCKMVWKLLIYLGLAIFTINPSRTLETYLEIILYSEQC